MRKVQKHFEGLYWRQMFVTVGMVLLTLLLLGAAFFSTPTSKAKTRNYIWDCLQSTLVLN